MTKITAAISAVGKYVPEYVLTNKELEAYVETNDEWITSRTGIKERRILKGEGLGTSFMAIKASEDLIKKSNIDPKEIDLVIVATATPDLPIASTAAYVATEIGATNAFGYDLQAACSSFLYGMSTASAYIASGRYKKVLLIGADKMSSIIDYSDRATCIIFGDGAGAVLFEPNNEGLGLQDEYLRSDGVGRDFLRIEAGGSQMPTTAETVANKKHFVYQEGKTVFKYAVSNMADVAEKMLTRNSLTEPDIQWLVAHQANKRIIEATAKRVGVPAEKVMINIHKYGNTTAATIPIAICEALDQGKFSKGDTIMLTAFGAGYTWASAVIRW